MPLKDNFRKGLPLAALRAAWLNAVAKALNTLTISLTDDPLPSIDKPANPSTRTPWRILIPRAAVGDRADRWGRTLIRAATSGDDLPGDVKPGDNCLWQYRETWDAATSAYKESERPTLIGKLPEGGGAGLPVGTIIPGNVYVKTNTNTLVQVYLKWDGAHFVEQTDDTGAPDEDFVAYLNVSYGPLTWEQSEGGVWELTQEVGYFSPRTPVGAWQRGDYTEASLLPAVSYAATHVPEIL